MQREPIAAGSKELRVTVDGLKGGHSGKQPGHLPCSHRRAFTMARDPASSTIRRFCSAHRRVRSLPVGKLTRAGHPVCATGLNIGDGRGNANRLLAITVAALLGAAPETRLVTIKGGDKRNALAREASAVLAVSSSNRNTPHGISIQGLTECKALVLLRRQQGRQTLAVAAAPPISGTQSKPRAAPVGQTAGLWRGFVHATIGIKSD